MIYLIGGLAPCAGRFFSLGFMLIRQQFCSNSNVVCISLAYVVLKSAYTISSSQFVSITRYSYSLKKKEDS